MANPYKNQLDALLTDPSSFQGTSGFAFARDSGNDAIARKYAAMGMGASGNVLGEMGKFTTGLATQDYGNQVDRLGRLAGQEDQTQLGQGNLALGNKTADQNFGLGLTRADNDYTLGAQSNNNTASRNWMDYALGRDRNNIDATNGANTFAINNGRNQIDAYGAVTNRGSAQANAWQGDQANQRAWYSINPKQRIAGAY